MRVPILTFAEYASVSADNQLTIAGTVDGVGVVRKPGTDVADVGVVQLPPLYLVAVLEGSISEGLQHGLGLRVVNEDKKVVVEMADYGRFNFTVNRHGRPMRAQLIIRLVGLAVPEPGDFEFILLVDGSEVGSAPFYVTDQTPTGSP